MRTLLHLYPGEVRARSELLERKRPWLAERSLRIVLADDWIAPIDQELYDGCIEVPPAEQVGAALSALREACRAQSIDGVLIQSEAAVPTGSLLAREMSLPGLSPEAALSSFAKHRTRQTLESARVPQPDFALVSDARGVRAFADSHGWPVMLKATASAMARLVVPVAGQSEVEAAVAFVRSGLQSSRDLYRLEAFASASALDLGIDPRETFLVESVAPGDPVECDGMIARGQAQAFGALEQVMTPPPRYYIGAYLMPADRSEEDLEAIEATGRAAALAVGLDAAGFSVEMRHDGETARVIEVNGRLGEDSGLHRLFECVVSADPFELAVAVALGEVPLCTPRRAPRYALAYRCSFEEATVAAVPTAEQLKFPGAEAGLCVRPGDELHAPPHPETFPHLAWVLASDPASSQAAFRRSQALASSLRFELKRR